MGINARMRVCACGAALFIGGTGVQAGLVESHTSESFGGLTDWIHVFQLPQFDDMDGARTLLSVVVTLDVTIDAMGSAENFESWDHLITLTLDAFVSLSFLDEPLVAPTGVHKDESFMASPFDGDFDFQGPSGASFDMGGFANASTTRSGADDLSPWIGDGTVDLVGMGVGLSSATGPGNVAFEFRTEAFGQVTIRYEYVPTPGAWLIQIASVMLLAPRRKRRAA